MIYLQQEVTNMRTIKVEDLASQTTKRFWANRQELSGKTVNGREERTIVWYEIIPLDENETFFVPTGRCGSLPGDASILPKSPHKYEIN